MPTVAQYRSDVDELVRLALVDLDVLWRDDPDIEFLRIVLPELTSLYGAATATVAADWFDELRDEQQVAGRHRAQVAAPPVERIAGTVDWLLDTTPDGIRQLAAGALQRAIADAGRDTIIGSSLDDPQARGWRRVTSHDACGFCRMLCDRGAVYGEATVHFGAHDNCSCSVAPSWDPSDLRLVSDFLPSTRDVPPAERARVRQWMREHGYQV